MRKLITLMAALCMTLLLQACGTAGATSGSDDTGSIPLSDSSGGGNAAPTTTFTGFAVVQVDGALSGKVVAFFSEDMDPASISTKTFSVADTAGHRVNGTVLYIGVTAVFTPVNDFQANTGYVATLSTGVRSLAGVPMAHAKVFAFTTPDPSQLSGVLVKVASVEPSADATDVALDSGVNVTFHQIMDPATINASTVSVYDADGAKVAGQVHYTGLTASFVPASHLAPKTTYRLVVSATTKSLAGIPMDDDYKSMFTTGSSASVPPQVVYTAPLQGDSGVDLGAGIVAAFNAPMDTASINTSTFSVVDGNGQPVDGSVSYVGSTAMFTPSAPLLPQAVYIATVSGSVVAAGGLAMGQDYSWAFKTGSFSTGNAPTVVFANPSPYQSNIWSNITISVAFSAVMDPMTLNTANFQVTDQDGNPVSGSISYIGNMAMFTPDAGLTAGTQYTVTLTSGIKDSSGVSLAAYSWSFTTMMLQ